MSDKVLRLQADKNGKLVVAGAAIAASAITLELPAQAATTGSVDDVSAMVTSLGGIAAAVTAVVLGAMGVRMAIKLVNRVGVKG